MKFRKKSFVVEAIQFDGTPDGALKVFEAFTIPGGKFLPNPCNLEEGILFIPSVDGPYDAVAGDWVIKGVNGQFRPCKPDTFEATYEHDEPEPIKPLIIPALAAEALAIQNTVSLIGLSKRFPKAIQELSDELKRQGLATGTDQINTHPITRAWVSKFDSLSGASQDSTWWVVECEKLQEQLRVSVNAPRSSHDNQTPGS